MGRALPTSETSIDRGHFVEVTDGDGILHHVGPFKLLADAERWIERNKPIDGVQPSTLPADQVDWIPHAV
jgi:hypothetical protein